MISSNVRMIMICRTRRIITFFAELGKTRAMPRVVNGSSVYPRDCCPGGTGKKSFCVDFLTVFGVPDGEIRGAVLSIWYSEDILWVCNCTAADRDVVDCIWDAIKKVLQPAHVCEYGIQNRIKTRCKTVHHSVIRRCGNPSHGRDVLRPMAERVDRNRGPNGKNESQKVVTWDGHGSSSNKFISIVFYTLISPQHTSLHISSSYSVFRVESRR